MHDWLVNTERLVLRPFEEADAEALYAIAAGNHTLRQMSDWPDDLAGVKRLIRRFKRNYDIKGPGMVQIVLAVTLAEGGLIGVIGVGDKACAGNEMEIAYFLLEKYANRGYMTEAVQGMAQRTFTNLKPVYLVALAAKNNHASQKVLEKNGFIKQDERLIPNPGFEDLTSYYYYRLDNTTGKK